NLTGPVGCAPHTIYNVMENSVSGNDAQADHLNGKAATSLRERISRQSRAIIAMFVLGVLFVVLLVGWFHRGSEIRELKSANRILNGRLRLAES
ncbi:MAG: hypothetical protein JSW47_22385, partial [Phycisphaerales bacterium]